MLNALSKQNDLKGDATRRRQACATHFECTAPRGGQKAPSRLAFAQSTQPVAFAHAPGALASLTLSCYLRIYPRNSMFLILDQLSGITIWNVDPHANQVCCTASRPVEQDPRSVVRIEIGS